MSAARIALSELGSQPPYLNGMQPQILWVSGRVSRNCARLAVTVRFAPNALPLFRGEVAPVFPALAAGADTNAPEHDAGWTASFGFDPLAPPFNALHCGVSLYVEAQPAVAGVDGAATATLRLSCKGAPATGGGTGTGGQPGGGDWWPWPLPPSIMCRRLRELYGAALVAALLAVAAAACWPSVNTWAWAAAAIGAAAVALGAWRWWCVPTGCEIWGVVCWAAKNSTLAVLGLALATMSGLGLLVVALCGAIAGIAVGRLHQHRCHVPPAGPWPF
jgi:hypothetical protein